MTRFERTRVEGEDNTMKNMMKPASLGALAALAGLPALAQEATTAAAAPLLRVAIAVIATCVLAGFSCGRFVSALLDGVPPLLPAGAALAAEVAATAYGVHVLTQRAAYVATLRDMAL